MLEPLSKGTAGPVTVGMPAPVIIPETPSGSQPRHAKDTPTINVLHVVNGEHFSGAERVQSHLGRCLPDFAVVADFACVKPGRFADMLDQQNGKWGQCHRTPMRGRFDVRPAGEIRRLVDRHGYQLLHAHTPRTAMITAIASRLTGIPWIYHVHSPTARDSARKWINRLNAWTERISLWRCDHLITVSESLRSDCIINGTHQDKVSVVHNGVPSIRPKRTSPPPKINGRWVVGMVALMRPRKGLEIALEAIAKLKADGHDVTLRVIGPFETEDYRQLTDGLIERLDIDDRIEKVGFTDNVPAELAKLDAMVLPSLFGEGLPMVVLEAMAAAVPVVATRVEGTPEAVSDGVEGVLAEPRDAASLAAAIASLVTGKYDWQEMAEAAFQTHARHFSDQAMANGTADVYRLLMQS